MDNFRELNARTGRVGEQTVMVSLDGDEKDMSDACGVKDRGTNSPRLFLCFLQNEIRDILYRPFLLSCCVVVHGDVCHD